MRETTKTREQSQTEAPRKATRKEWLGLAVLGMASLVVAIDLFVMLLALPKINQDLHTSGTQLLWITDMYGFLLAGFLITILELESVINLKWLQKLLEVIFLLRVFAI